MSGFLVAAVQMGSTGDKTANLETALALVQEAAARGARLVALPELFNCLATPDKIVAQAEPIPGPSSDAMCQAAARLGVTIVAGSIAERAVDADRPYNTSLVISPAGKILGRYRKLHLFGIDLPGHIAFQEAKFLCGGDRLVISTTECGVIGQSICFDLRFPELYRRLAAAGADLLCVPSAFTMQTGRDHWEILVRARAIENQVYVIAPNQLGRHTPTLSTCGRTMIVDPWGVPLAIARDTDCVIVAEVDPAHASTIRSRLPAMQSRLAIESFPLDKIESDA
jgi:predicted amidohydrolase